MLIFFMMLLFLIVRVVVVGDQFCVVIRNCEPTNDFSELIFRTSLYPHPLVTQYRKDRTEKTAT
jgi:hypothetical protein